MTINYRKLRRKYNDPALFSLVNAWLNAKVASDCMRVEVEKIERSVLQAIPLYDHAGARITDPALVYTCRDQSALDPFYEKCNQEKRRANLSQGLPNGACPALVARNRVVYIEHAIADLVCPVLDIKKQELLTVGDGIVTWNRFINLTVQAVINNPRFEPVNIYEQAKK